MPFDIDKPTHTLISGTPALKEGDSLLIYRGILQINKIEDLQRIFKAIANASILVEYEDLYENRETLNEKLT